MSPLSELAGWAGSLLVLGAYALTSAGRVDGQSVLYHALNAAGAAGLAVNVIAHGAWPASVLELAWTAIALVSLARIAVRRV